LIAAPESRGNCNAWFGNAERDRVVQDNRATVDWSAVIDSLRGIRSNASS